MLPGVSSGDTIKAIDKLPDESLPLSMKAEWTEVMFLQIRAAERNPAIYVFALSVVSVFLALAALYESWALPLAVILVVPMCLLCSRLGVLYTGRDVNIFVQIGLVVLVGLACKNAILIVEYAKQKHLEGWSRLRGDAGGVPAAAAADPDDLARVHHRRDPAGCGRRGRGRDAPVAGHCRVQRHGGRDAVRHLLDAGVFLGDPGVQRDAAASIRGGAMDWIHAAVGGPGGLRDRLRCSRRLGDGVRIAPGRLGLGVRGCLAALVVLGIHQHDPLSRPPARAGQLPSSSLKSGAHRWRP